MTGHIVVLNIGRQRFLFIALNHFNMRSLPFLFTNWSVSSRIPKSMQAGPYSYLFIRVEDKALEDVCCCHFGGDRGGGGAPCRWHCCTATAVTSLKRCGNGGIGAGEADGAKQ